MNNANYFHQLESAPNNHFLMQDYLVGPEIQFDPTFKNNSAPAPPLSSFGGVTTAPALIETGGRTSFLSTENTFSQHNSHHGLQQQQQQQQQSNITEKTGEQHKICEKKQQCQKRIFAAVATEMQKIYPEIIKIKCDLLKELEIKSNDKIRSEKIQCKLCHRLISFRGYKMHIRQKHKFCPLCMSFVASNTDCACFIVLKKTIFFDL